MPRNGAAPNMVLQSLCGSPLKNLQTHCPGSTTQAFFSILAGSADRQNLRGVPAAVLDLRWENATDRLCHRKHADKEDPKAHLCGARPIALAGLCYAKVGWAVKDQLDWDLAAQLAPDYEVDLRVNG